jgi:hypothetical protein
LAADGYGLAADGYDASAVATCRQTVGVFSHAAAPSCGI